MKQRMAQMTDHQAALEERYASETAELQSDLAAKVQSLQDLHQKFKETVEVRIQSGIGHIRDGGSCVNGINASRLCLLLWNDAVMMRTRLHVVL